MNIVQINIVSEKFDFFIMSFENIKERRNILYVYMLTSI